MSDDNSSLDEKVSLIDKLSTFFKKFNKGFLIAIAVILGITILYVLYSSINKQTSYKTKASTGNLNNYNVSTNKKILNDAECIKKSGSCQTSASKEPILVGSICNIDGVSGKYERDLCPGGAETRCCVPDVQDENVKNPCKNIGGECQSLDKAVSVDTTGKPLFCKYQDKYKGEYVDVACKNKARFCCTPGKFGGCIGINNKEGCDYNYFCKWEDNFCKSKDPNSCEELKLEKDCTNFSKWKCAWNINTKTCTTSSVQK